jgi:hypothetical protein
MNIRIRFQWGGGSGGGVRGTYKDRRDGLGTFPKYNARIQRFDKEGIFH